MSRTKLLQTSLTYNDRRAVALAAAAGGARSLDGKFRWSSRGQPVAHMTIRRLIDRGLMARVDEKTVELTGAGHELAETMNVDSYVEARQTAQDVTDRITLAADVADSADDAPVAFGSDGTPMPVDVFMRRYE